MSTWVLKSPRCSSLPTPEEQTSEETAARMVQWPTTWARASSEANWRNARGQGSRSPSWTVASQVDFGRRSLGDAHCLSHASQPRSLRSTIGAQSYTASGHMQTTSLLVRRGWWSSSFDYRAQWSFAMVIVLSLQDNMATSGAFTKGRSAAPSLNFLARQRGATAVAADLGVMLPWVQTSLQPADEISRL